jgi:hypothetical protein
MPRPSVYLDECVDHALAPALHQRGFAVTTAIEAHLLGADDERQLRFAAEQDLVLLSHNWRHFQRWHRAFQQRDWPHGGIVVLPSGSPLPQLTIRAALLLDWLTTLPDWHTQLFRWGDLQFRLTQGFRVSEYHEADVRLALAREPA